MVRFLYPFVATKLLNPLQAEFPQSPGSIPTLNRFEYGPDQ
jgi:hypothetical protein